MDLLEIIRLILLIEGRIEKKELKPSRLFA